MTHVQAAPYARAGPVVSGGVVVVEVEFHR